MIKKKWLSGILAAAMLVGLMTPMPQAASAATAGATEIVLEKSTLGNPIAGFDEYGNITYAGDPTILVDGDTVYLYVGHDDTGSGGGYTMPNYLCYSTQDMINWEYHGSIMEMTTVSWADNVSAWASQAIRHNGKYYLYYCAETGSGKAVGVAVADSPTGPYKDQGKLVSSSMTNTETYVIGDSTAKNLYGRKSSFGWEDIDPTIWIDTDESGEEHAYLMWGNSNLWMCELNEDMISVKDQDKNGVIEQGEDKDLWYQNITGIEKIAANGNQSDIVDFTEAPWLYRRRDADGKAYGSYYVFFAMHWREEMGYATTDDITSGQWTYGGKLMEPTATSNTNHPAVFDFNGHTYFIYHNGSLPGGSGYRRVVCVEELVFNEDGSIDYIQETSTGISGTASQILDNTDTVIAHEKFSNNLYDSYYPQRNIAVSANNDAEKADAMWEIEPGKADKNNDAYVTIEAFNKPGMYLMVNDSYEVVLSHDSNNDSAAPGTGITVDSESMTFRTLEGFAGRGVTFESVAYPGYYLTSENGALIVSENPDNEACTFEIGPAENISAILAQKVDRTYEVGETLNVDDIRVRVTYDDGTTKTITEGFTTNAASVDMNTAGSKQLIVTYKEKGIVRTSAVNLNVVAKTAIAAADIDPADELPAKGSAYTVGNLKYKVTKTDEYNTDGSNGTVTVTGIKSKSLKSVVIPAEVKIGEYTFKVTAIGAKAFYKCSKLKTITIGDNVKSIGKNAINGINKKATIKVSSGRYKAVKKLLKSNTGYKKTMKIKKMK